MDNGANPSANAKFLYDKRLALLNTRRDQEWKIYFGTTTLILGMDAGCLIYHVSLTGPEAAAWILAVAILGGALVLYEHGLQPRNRRDHKAMIALYQMLCDEAKIDDNSLARYLPGGSPGGPLQRTWPVASKLMVLAVLLLVSWAVPFMRVENKEPNGDRASGQMITVFGSPAERAGDGPSLPPKENGSSAKKAFKK